MDPQTHYVSGFFATRDEALEARTQLIERGLPLAQIQLYESDLPATAPVPTGDSNAILKDVVVDGAIGTAVGTGLGALAQVAIVAANVSLFVASPLLAPLVMIGWGASLGAVVGASVGATAKEKATPEGKQGWLDSLVRDAIASGQVVLMVDARTVEQTRAARDVIRASVGDAKDVVAA